VTASTILVRARTVLLLLVVAAGLAGCGKKGAPQPPGPPGDVSYPRAYPAY
jgi:predicted small lipoprotein YifL